LTLLERSAALEQYVKRLQVLQTEYERRVEEAAAKIADAYEKACQQELEALERDAKVWKDDTDRLVEQAREEMEHQAGFVSHQSNFLSKALNESDQDHFDDNVPSQLRCPITLNLMADPVVAADGNTYERKALEAWFATQKTHKPTSPLTGADLPTKAFFPVHALRAICQQFAKEDQTEATVRYTF
jgi:hypothetical protein